MLWLWVPFTPNGWQWALVQLGNIWHTREMWWGNYIYLGNFHIFMTLGETTVTVFWFVLRMPKRDNYFALQQRSQSQKSLNIEMVGSASVSHLGWPVPEHSWCHISIRKAIVKYVYILNKAQIFSTKNYSLPLCLFTSAMWINCAARHVFKLARLGYRGLPQQSSWCKLQNLLEKQSGYLGRQEEQKMRLCQLHCKNEQNITNKYLNSLVSITASGQKVVSRDKCRTQTKK